MTITFNENNIETVWKLSTEEERLLEALRLRLPEQESPRTAAGKPQREPLPRFSTIADMIHTHIADSLLLEQIRVETENTFRAAAIEEVTKRRKALEPARTTIPITSR